MASSHEDNYYWGADVAGLTQSQATALHGGEHTMVDVGLDDGSVVSATDGHPFWDVSTGTFTDAIDLEVGELVLTLDGESLQVTSVIVYGEDLVVYNLEIEGIHTYYAGVTPVLVHNSCGGGPDELSAAGVEFRARIPASRKLARR